MDLASATQDVVKTSNNLDVLMFHLRIEKNMTEKEISTLLGLPRPKVSTRLSRMYDKIKDATCKS